jgi:hypothetical protein
MRFPQPPFILLLLFLFPLQPALAQSPDTQQQSPDSPANPPATAKPIKIWTNENISAIHGVVSVVGGSAASAATRGPRHSDSTSNGGTILSPPNGTLVHPGETLHIEATLDPGVTPAKAVAIISDIGDSNEFRESPPYSFTFTVPQEEPRSGGPLLGFHSLTLFGTVIGRKNDYDLASIDVDVEEPDLPISLFVAYEPSPTHLHFYDAGNEKTVSIVAKFPDGQELYVTNSTCLQFLSGNPAVIRVFDDGTVTSVGSGETYLIVNYTLGAQQKQLSVLVTVEVRSQGLVATPSTVDFGDVPVGTASPPHQVTIVNNSASDIKIFELQYKLEQDNCSNTTLAPGGSCTFAVSFAPATRAAVHWTMYITNNHTRSTAITLYANGI